MTIFIFIVGFHASCIPTAHPLTKYPILSIISSLSPPQYFHPQFLSLLGKFNSLDQFVESVAFGCLFCPYYVSLNISHTWVRSFCICPLPDCQVLFFLIFFVWFEATSTDTQGMRLALHLRITPREPYGMPGDGIHTGFQWPQSVLWPEEFRNMENSWLRGLSVNALQTLNFFFFFSVNDM